MVLVTGSKVPFVQGVRMSERHMQFSTSAKSPTRSARETQPVGGLRKRRMPLKNSLPEAFSALILVFSNQDGEYLWLPLLLSRALSAV
jgi:hypothetical protein